MLMAVRPSIQWNPAGRSQCIRSEAPLSRQRERPASVSVESRILPQLGVGLLVGILFVNLFSAPGAHAPRAQRCESDDACGVFHGVFSLGGMKFRNASPICAADA